MDQSIIDNAVNELRGRLCHVCEQTVHIPSNCCDNNNTIQSYEKNYSFSDK